MKVYLKNKSVFRQGCAKPGSRIRTSAHAPVLQHFLNKKLEVYSLKFISLSTSQSIYSFIIILPISVKKCSSIKFTIYKW